jgi:hypothetical protein
LIRSPGKARGLSKNLFIVTRHTKMVIANHVGAARRQHVR